MIINAWLIKRSTMGGRDFLEDAYKDENTCKLICENYKEEFVGYTPVLVQGELISNNRLIVNNKVYTLSEQTSQEILYQRAVKKITPEELDAIKFFVLNNMQNS